MTSDHAYRVALWGADVLEPTQVVASGLDLPAAYRTALRTMTSLRWIQRVYGHDAGTIAIQRGHR